MPVAFVEVADFDRRHADADQATRHGIGGLAGSLPVTSAPLAERPL